MLCDIANCHCGNPPLRNHRYWTPWFHQYIERFLPMELWIKIDHILKKDFKLKVSERVPINWLFKGSPCIRGIRGFSFNHRSCPKRPYKFLFNWEVKIKEGKLVAYIFQFQNVKFKHERLQIYLVEIDGNGVETTTIQDGFHYL